MYSKAHVKQIIKDAIIDVSGWESVSDNDYLIDKTSKVIPSDFLYIFDIIEKKLGIPAHSIFEKENYDVMTINNLTVAFYERQEP